MRTSAFAYPPYKRFGKAFKRFDTPSISLRSMSAKIGYGPGLIPMQRRDAENAFNMFLKAGVDLVTVPRGSEMDMLDMVNLMEGKGEVDRKNITLLEMVPGSILPTPEEFLSMKPSDPTKFGIAADRIMIHIPWQSEGYDDKFLEDIIGRAEVLVSSERERTREQLRSRRLQFPTTTGFPGGYGISCVALSEVQNGDSRQLTVERLWEIANKCKTIDGPYLQAIQCPVNIFETEVLSHEKGSLAMSRELKIDFYADQALHSSPLYKHPPVSFLSSAVGARDALAAVDMEREADLGSEKEEIGEGLARVLKERFNTLIGLEKQYRAMVEKAGSGSQLPSSQDIAWGHIILSNREELHNAIRWEHAKRSTIIPRARRAVDILKHQQREFNTWGTSYLQVLMDTLDLFGASVHITNQTQNSLLTEFLRNRLQGKGRDLHRLEEICVSLLRCTGVTNVLVDSIDSLTVTGESSAIEMSSEDALRIMSDAKNYFKDRIIE